jgi:hypothetical protein
MQLEEAIKIYVAKRDELDAKRKEFKEFESHFKSKLDDLALFIGNVMGDAESVKTAAGTAFRATKDFASVQDSEQFFSYILQSGDVNLLNKAANKTGVKEYMDEHEGIAPPGIEYGTKVEIQIRRPSK